MNEKKILTNLERLVYENKYARLFDNNVTFPGDVKGRYLKFEWTAPYGVGVLPILSDGRIQLVRSYRYASEQMSIEIPKGFGESQFPPVEMARRELMEETGLEASTFTEIACLRTEAGLMNHRLHIFRAVSCVQAASPSPECSEVFAEPVILPLEEAIALVMAGTIDDAVTIAALLLHRLAKTS